MRRLTDEERQEHRRQLKREERQRNKHVSPIRLGLTPHGGTARVDEDEAAARLAEIPDTDRRSLTGVVFGDPPPGRSALDRERSCSPHTEGSAS